MPATIAPKDVQEAAHRGIERLRNFRNARLMFLRNYTGQYYDRENGAVGTEALNLIFNAIRVLVPNLVMTSPRHVVNSRFLAYRPYAELLTLALDQHSQQTNIDAKYRQAVVDAVFTLGVLKTGLAESDSVYAFDDYDRIDAGEVFTENVDFDNLIVDPNSREHLFADAAFIGDRMCIPRQKLLDSGLYRNDLVEQLPSIADLYGEKQAHQLSMRRIKEQDNYDLQDEVEIAELWFPDAKAVVTVPASKDTVLAEYLRVNDYYGPDTGPYTFLALTPNVPGNPLPVPMVGVWNDLHILANKMAHKVVNQAMRQKDVVAYRRAAADDAAEMRDAQDGDAIAVDDVDGMKMMSWGGQKASNEVHLQSLMGWFNQMAANPQAVGGQTIDADSATEANILQTNATIGLDDMKSLVYKMGAEEGRKRAFYFHTDPLIRLPLIRRQPMPAQFAQGPTGPVMIQPARMSEEQVFLTPEARAGDFLAFAFSLEPESMGRPNSATRLKQAMEFAVKILPAAAAAAQTMALLGIPFSAPKFILKMAKDSGITWMDEVFYDEEFQMHMAMMMMAGPKPEGSKGQLGGGGNPMAAIIRNGQPGQVGAVPSQQEETMAGYQAGANEGQADLKMGAF